MTPLLSQLGFGSAVGTLEILKQMMIQTILVISIRTLLPNIGQASEVPQHPSVAAARRLFQWKMTITAVVAGVEESFCVVNLKDAIVVFIFIVLAFPQFLKALGSAPYTATPNTQST